MGRHVKEKWIDIIETNIKPIYKISSWGNIANKYTGKRIKPEIDKDGYARYTLQGYGKKVKVYGHRLTAKYFVENPDIHIFNEVNHKNLKKSDNYYKNLEWVTHQENIDHSIRHKAQIHLACAAHGYTTMSNETVLHICELLEQGVRVKDILSILGYTRKNMEEYEKMRGRIKMIKSRKSWTALSYRFKF